MADTTSSTTASPGAVGWPLWGPEDGDELLAQYLSLESVAYIDLPVAAEALRDSADLPGSDRRVAEDRYAALATRRLKLARHPWLPALGDAQQVRSPEWVLSARGGRCLDLVVFYASLCLEGHVAPLLAIDDHHALVVLRLGWLTDPLRHGRAQPPRGSERVGDGCTYRIVDPQKLDEAIDNGDFLAVECTAFTDPVKTFDEACALGRRRLLGEMRLVDVSAAAEERRVHALRAPGPRPPISTYAPVRRRPRRLYASQSDALQDIVRWRGGTVVLHGPRGQGKSTVAQELTRLAPRRAAWFLDASDGAQLRSSLADAELAEASESAVELTAVSRDEHAQSALARLNETTESWTVVLDNADAGPSSVGALRPRPKAGQLVVITTVNDKWRDAPNVHWVELEPASEDDVLEVLNDSRLLPLVDGRALLVEAYRRYLDNDGTPEQLHTAAGGLDPDDELTGPRALVRAAFGARDGSRWSMGAHCALLPPDRVPRSVLQRLGGPEEVADLVSIGVLDDNELHVGELQMHRLMGGAVRAEAPSLLPGNARRLARDPDALTALDLYADPPTMGALVEALTSDAEVSGDRALGIALYDVAAVLETKGNVPLSSELYEAAEGLLDESLFEDQLRLARCWLGQARAIYQTKAGQRAELDRGRELALRAEELISEIQDPDAAGRYIAMRGLIEKAAALLAPPAQQLNRLEAALAVLVDADERRQRRSRVEGGADAAELLRSTYNLAGIRIDIAKRKRSDAAELLREADDIYEAVRTGRISLYGRSLHPHVAACIHGKAIVGYYRALLVDDDVSDRIRHLREAQVELLAGLAQREQLSGGEQSSDVHKSLALLTKIAMARDVLPVRSTEKHFAELGDVTAELSRSGLVN